MVATVGKGWSLARSLVAMFDEADKRWPKRSRASDGSIGDADHKTRTSDHNPDSTGDVLAGDLTDDKDAGCDADLFAEHLRKSRDPRVKYVICNGRVFRSYGSSAWQWTPYSGINGHFAHTHVSILDTAAAKNDTSPWFPYADAPIPHHPTPSRARAVHSRGGAMFHPTTPGRADDFWVDDNGHVGHEWTTDDGMNWAAEVLDDGEVASNFAWSWNADGSKLRLFCIGTDGKRYERLSVGGQWTAWSPVRGQG